MWATGSGVLAAASSQVIMNALDASAQSAIAGSLKQLDEKPALQRSTISLQCHGSLQVWQYLVCIWCAAAGHAQGLHHSCSTLWQPLALSNMPCNITYDSRHHHIIASTALSPLHATCASFLSHQHQPRPTLASHNAAPTLHLHAAASKHPASPHSPSPCCHVSQ